MKELLYFVIVLVLIYIGFSYFGTKSQGLDEKEQQITFLNVGDTLDFEKYTLDNGAGNKSFFETKEKTDSTIAYSFKRTTASIITTEVCFWLNKGRIIKIQKIR